MCVRVYVYSRRLIENVDIYWHLSGNVALNLDTDGHETAKCRAVAAARSMMALLMHFATVRTSVFIESLLSVLQQIMKC